MIKFLDMGILEWEKLFILNWFKIFKEDCIVFKKIYMIGRILFYIIGVLYMNMFCSIWVMIIFGIDIIDNDG